jgi:hypothetical protein
MEQFDAEMLIGRVQFIQCRVLAHHQDWDLIRSKMSPMMGMPPPCAGQRLGSPSFLAAREAAFISGKSNGISAGFLLAT